MRAATMVVRISRESASCRIRSVQLGIDFTAPVTSHGCSKTAASSALAASITRLRFAGFVSIWAKSNLSCARCLGLVAYWVGDSDRDALRSCACTKLPAYMVPSGYIPLAVFPLNTNGKIDRKALPRPEPEVQDVTQVRRPRDDREAQIAAIWSEVLGRPCIGIDQDFFALGGTSALAIEARARTERALCAELPLRAMFESPTVEAVAKRFGQGGRQPGQRLHAVDRIVAVETGSVCPLRCCPGQGS